MKLASWRRDGRDCCGALVEGTLHELGGDMLALLRGGPAALRDAQDALARRTAAEGVPLSAVQLLAPVPRPGKILAVGRNYPEHAREAARAQGAHGAGAAAPRMVAKLSSSVCGPGSAVRIPAAVAKPDYEVELAAVIGSPARDVDARAALSAVAGYTIVNDISARELQFDVSPPQTTFAKSADGFCPMGPFLVTADEVGDPQALGLSLWVNGDLRQHASTAGMIHTVADIVAHASRYMTLEPGDVICTGTPAGVGALMDPPRWLRPGDRLVLEIERIGRLEHAIG